MSYEAMNFDHLLGTEGFSDRLLRDHFTLYRGYVEKTNQLIETLGQLSQEGKAATPAYSEMKRRFGWEWNGMRLHEYYFGNLKTGGSAMDRQSDLGQTLADAFGSFENWTKAFRAVAAMRGIGWAVLYYDPVGRRVFNAWIDQHDGGHLAGASPILVLDAFEHAYVADYGVKRDGYIDAFLKAVDWSVASERMNQALERTPALASR